MSSKDRQASLSIRESCIPDAGRGLFAERNFKKGEVIVEYVGQHLTKAQLDARHGAGELNLAPYAIQVSDDLFIDADPRYTGPAEFSVARYANDARNAKLNNAKFSIIDNLLYLVASKNIDKDSEIYVDYGANYWERNHKSIRVLRATICALQTAHPGRLSNADLIVLIKPTLLDAFGNVGNVGKDGITRASYKTSFATVLARQTKKGKYLTVDKSVKGRHTYGLTEEGLQVRCVGQ